MATASSPFAPHAKGDRKEVQIQGSQPGHVSPIQQGSNSIPVYSNTVSLNSFPLTSTLPTSTSTSFPISSSRQTRSRSTSTAFFSNSLPSHTPNPITIQSSSSTLFSDSLPSSFESSSLSSSTTTLSTEKLETKIKQQSQYYHLNQYDLDEIKEAFNAFDTNRTGRLEVRDIKHVCTALGMEIKRDELKATLRSLNEKGFSSNSNGLLPLPVSVTLEELITILTPKLRRRDSQEEIMKVFQLFDKEGSGFINFQSLKHVCQEINQPMSDQDIRDLIDEADRDHDGRVTAEDFYRIMKRRNGPLDQWDSDED